VIHAQLSVYLLSVIHAQLSVYLLSVIHAQLSVYLLSVIHAQLSVYLLSVIHAQLNVICRVFLSFLYKYRDVFNFCLEYQSLFPRQNIPST
jgi:hypothetical protein